MRWWNRTFKRQRNRSREEQIAECEAMIQLWDRVLFRGKPDAREELAFWRAVLAQIERTARASARAVALSTG